MISFVLLANLLATLANVLVEATPILSGMPVPLILLRDILAKYGQITDSPTVQRNTHRWNKSQCEALHFVLGSLPGVTYLRRVCNWKKM